MRAFNEDGKDSIEQSRFYSPVGVFSEGPKAQNIKGWGRGVLSERILEAVRSDLTSAPIWPRGKREEAPRNLGGGLEAGRPRHRGQGPLIPEEKGCAHNASCGGGGSLTPDPRSLLLK